MKFLSSLIGTKFQRVTLAALIAIGLGAGCSSSHSASNKDGGAKDGNADSKTKPDAPGGKDSSVDACGAQGAPQDGGAGCSCNAQCASGFCVEGVCCNTACAGGCFTCSSAASMGICTKRAAGTDPRAPTDCPAGTQESCGLDGACDGNGACRYYLGTTCIGGTCQGDAVVGAFACDGTGQCKPGTTTLCVPFTCNTATGDCVTDCTSNNQCVSGQSCEFSTGSCGQVGPGGHCTSDTQCLSGRCADSVCCNVACDGPCVACNLPGHLGTCRAIDAGQPDPRGICEDTGAPSCGHDGTCDGLGSCANYPRDTQCLAPSCTGNRLNTAGTCDGLGTCRPPGAQDCHPFRCADGACTTTCQTDGDCDTGTACDNGTCGPKPIGQTCAASTECASGFCVDNVCCENACAGACRTCALPTSPGFCMTVAAGNPDPRSVCTDQGAASCGTDGKCDGTGSCESYAVNTVCAAETCTSGIYTPPSTCAQTGQCVAPDSRACAPYVCNGSQCFNACATNDQCKPPNSCTASSCGLKSNGASCSTPAECSSGFCAQGICCNLACNGTCQSCALTLGSCINVPAGAADPQGTCSDKGAPSCGTNGKCNGNGACQKYGQGTTCIGSSCPSGTTVFTAASTCDGAGNCVTPAAAPCFPYQCGVNICKNSCVSDSDCASPAVCNGGFCGLKINGQTCATAAECLSGFCSQQTCCATACTGVCQSCGLTNSAGTCTNVTAGAADPQATCRVSGSATCGTDGFCDGNGACRLYAAGTSCAAPSCPSSASTLTSGRTCDGKGACQAATTSSCAPFLCNGSTACKATCTADSDCLAPDICDIKVNVCGNKKRLGQACTQTSDCLTGDSCVDGVCCSSSSCATCQACNVSSNPGSCSPVPLGTPEPHSLCTASPPCGDTGACDGNGACQLAGTTVSCGTVSCSGSTFTPLSHCNGSGACAAPTSSSCSPFVCGPAACKTTCTADADCLAPFTCQGSGANQSCALKPNGLTCASASQCISGFCTDGVCCGSGPCGTCAACNVNGLGSCAPIPTGMPAPSGQCAKNPPCGNTGNCNGGGGCQQTASSVSCAAASCSGTTFTPAAFCSGSGSCSPPTTSSCSPLVCGTGACKTSCNADTDCIPGDYCSGPGGSCLPIKSNGALCGSAHECTSVNCVDGVCCGSASCPLCQACNVNGAGTCANVGVVAEPHSRCSANGVCGNTGLCNGGGACQQTSSSTVCANASCSGTTFTAAATCSGTGGPCPAGATSSCSPYVCGATACNGSCAGDGGCVPGYYCTSTSGGSCAAKKGLGASCAAAHECTSANCVDGVCCSSGPCTTTCQACNVAGAAGNCAPIPSGQAAPAGQCTTSPSQPCGNTGACNGSNGCQQASASLVCAGPSCSGATFTPTAFCSGTGSCTPATPTTCGAYVCSSATSCKTSCTMDSDCVSGDYCASSGACLPRSGLGIACGGPDECTSRNCVDGACCATASCMSCQACNLNGAGTCSNVGNNVADPHTRCAPVTTCGDTGACDGNGNCQQAPSTTSCGSAVCSGTLFTPASFCSGSGSCKNATQQDCSPFTCSSGGCTKTSCQSDNDCASVDYCTGPGGSCLPLGIAGSPCTGNNQCGAGLFCTDGYCCGSSLCPTCQSCGVLGSQGMCTNVPAGGADPTGTCTGMVQPASTCGHDGLCNGGGGCELYGTSTMCLSTCVGELFTETFCDGSGLCDFNPTINDCTPNACDDTLGCQGP